MKKYIQQFSQWLKPGKSYSINKISKSFTCKEDRGIVDKKIWTDEQEKDLDQRFLESEGRMKTYIDIKIEGLRVEINNKLDSSIKLIIDILSRNGIK